MSKGIVLLLLCCLFLSGCMPAGVVPVQGNKTVKVGIIAPLSGPASTYGTDAINVYKYFFEKYNADRSTTIPIEMIIEDGQCDGKAAASATQKLITIDKVDILQAQCSPEVMVAGIQAQKSKTTLLSPFASKPEISDMGDRIYRFWNDAQSTIVFADYLNKSTSSLVVLTENTPAIVAIRDKTKQKYKGKINYDELLSSEEKDYDLVIKQLQQSYTSGDSLLLLVQTESTAIGLIRALDKAGLYKKLTGQIYGAFLFGSQTFLDGVGSLAEGLKQVNINITTDSQQKFLQEFSFQYPVASEQSFILLWAEGAQILIDAIKQGARESDDFKRYFDTIHSPETARSGYFGSYYFDTNGDAVGFPFTMQIIKAGKAVNL